MAAVSLSWDTNMAAVTSCENTLLELTTSLGLCQSEAKIVLDIRVTILELLFILLVRL